MTPSTKSCLGRILYLSAEVPTHAVCSQVQLTGCRQLINLNINSGSSGTIYVNCTLAVSHEYSLHESQNTKAKQNIHYLFTLMRKAFTTSCDSVTVCPYKLSYCRAELLKNNTSNKVFALHKQTETLINK